jgi:diguanylate cyclase (GGDEF)-like protein/PAS domain S-box-containing protein
MHGGASEMPDQTTRPEKYAAEAILDAETRARAGEARHRRIIETAADGYVCVDAAGIVTDFNTAAERMFRRGRDDVLGKHVLDALFPLQMKDEVGEAVRAWLDRPGEQAQPDSYELTALRSDGSEFVLEISPWSWPDGSVHAFMSDITQKRADQQTLQQHSAILNTISDAVVVVNRELTVIELNAAAERLFQLPRQRLLGPITGDPADANSSAGRARAMLSGVEHNGSWRGDVPIVDGSGNTRNSEVAAVATRDPDGSITGFIAVHRDVTSEREVARALERSEQRWRLTFDDAPVGIALTGLDGSLQRANAAFCRFTGYPATQLATMRYADITHPADVDLDLELLRQLVAGEITHYQLDKRYVRPSGEHAWGSMSVSLLRDADGSPLNLIAFVEDISKRRAHTDQLMDLAARDPLTGLANRAVLIERLELAVAQRAQGIQFALAFLDLDGFKAVNDQFGHQAGDELLRAASRRIVDGLRSSDLAARFGGDEFAILLQPISGEQDLETVAERLLGQIATPFPLNSTTARLSASIGIMHGAEAMSGTDLIAAADAAMYDAKLAGKNTYRIR